MNPIEKFPKVGAEKFSQTGTINFLKMTGAHFLTPAEIEKLPNKELHRIAQNYGAQSRKAQKEFAAFLPEINKRKLFLEYNFYSIWHYAAVVGGLSNETVNEVLRVSEKLQDKPLLMALLPTQGWSKLRVIAGIATAETQEFWKEKIEDMSKSTLETFVQELKKQDDLQGTEGRDGVDGRAGSAERGKDENNSKNAAIARIGNQSIIDFGNPKVLATERQNAVVQTFLPGEELELKNEICKPADVAQERNNISFKVTVDIEKQLRLFKFKLEKERKQPVDWNEVMQEFLKIAMQVQEHVCSQASEHVCAKEGAAEDKTCAKVQNEPMKASKPKKAIAKPTLTKEEIQKSLPEKSTRHIPARVQRYIKQIYQEMCGYPDCKQPANIDHHTRRFKLIPNHDPEFIVSLCKNHERLAHLGLIKNEEYNPKFWGLRLTADQNEPKFAVDKIVNQFRLAPTSGQS